MAERGVLVVGAGGHAKVCIELLRASGREVAGVVSPTGAAVLGALALGTDADLPALFGRGHSEAFVALGDNAARLAAGHQLRELGFTLVNAISPSAMISPSAKLGSGVAVMAGAVINASVEVGDFAVINTRASIDHDGVLGAACHIAPGATLAGNVTVGDGAFVGVGVSVKQGVSIGAGTQVGAGAAVVGDLPSGALAYGVPARVIRSLQP